MGWHTFLHSWTFMHEELMTSHKVLSLRSTRSESQAFCWSRFNEHLLLLHVEHLVHWWIMQIRHHLFLHYIIRHGMKSNVQNLSRSRAELEQNLSRTQTELKNLRRTHAELEEKLEFKMFQIFSFVPCLTSFFTTYEYSLTHELWKKTSTELN